MHQVSRSLLITSWGWAVVFVITLAWPYVMGGVIPLPGLAKLTESSHLVAMSVALVCCSFYLSIPRIKKRDSLLLLAGTLGCLSVIGFVFVSVPFGIAATSLFYGVMQTVKAV